MTRYIKRGGQVWIKIFPDKPVTAKPAETRMGSGKGALEYWVAVVKPGRVMFEIAGVSEEIAREALRLAMHKLPCKCLSLIHIFNSEIYVEIGKKRVNAKSIMGLMTLGLDAGEEITLSANGEDEEALSLIHISCLDVADAEGAIYDRELTDILDILQEVLREAKSGRRVK